MPKELDIPFKDKDVENIEKLLTKSKKENKLLSTTDAFNTIKDYKLLSNWKTIWDIFSSEKQSKMINWIMDIDNKVTPKIDIKKLSSKDAKLLLKDKGINVNWKIAAQFQEDINKTNLQEISPKPTISKNINDIDLIKSIQEDYLKPSSNTLWYKNDIIDYLKNNKDTSLEDFNKFRKETSIKYWVTIWKQVDTNFKKDIKFNPKVTTEEIDKIETLWGLVYYADKSANNNININTKIIDEEDLLPKKIISKIDKNKSQIEDALIKWKTLNKTQRENIIKVLDEVWSALNIKERAEFLKGVRSSGDAVKDYKTTIDKSSQIYNKAYKNINKKIIDEFKSLDIKNKKWKISWIQSDIYEVIYDMYKPAIKNLQENWDISWLVNLYKNVKEVKKEGINLFNARQNEIKNIVKDNVELGKIESNLKQQKGEPIKDISNLEKWEITSKVMDKIFWENTHLREVFYWKISKGYELSNIQYEKIITKLKPWVDYLCSKKSPISWYEFYVAQLAKRTQKDINWNNVNYGLNLILNQKAWENLVGVKNWKIVYYDKDSRPITKKDIDSWQNIINNNKQLSELENLKTSIYKELKEPLELVWKLEDNILDFWVDNYIWIKYLEGVWDKSLVETLDDFWETIPYSVW
jgi:hypothetical protein